MIYITQNNLNVQPWQQKKDKINKLGVNNAAKKHKNFCWNFTCQKLI